MVAQSAGTGPSQRWRTNKTRTGEGGGKLSILEHVDPPVGPPEVCVEGLRKVLLLLLLCFVAPFTDQESEASHSPVAQRSSSNVKECS